MTIPAGSATPIPEFDTWVEACFTLPNDDEYWTRCQLSGQDLAEYLARLFENPAFLSEKFTRKQLGDGIWLICGCVLGFFHDAMDRSVPEPARHRWIRAIGTLYTDLFDPLSHALSLREQKSDPLCIAAFMLWDMDALSFAQTYPELREDCFEVLHVALNCQSDTCVRSGLHGLGHWIQEGFEYDDGDAVLKARLKKCVNEFLFRYRWQWRARMRESLDRFFRVRPDPSPKLIQYAKDARSGCIG